jgi:Fe-S cluster biosynthesis and repair protein YggX
VNTVLCRRCSLEKPGLARPPFQGDRGLRIQARLCADCWGDWLRHQTLLINHYGLDPRDPKAREFLYEQVDKVLLGGDGDAAQVDTSKQGTIKW